MLQKKKDQCLREREKERELFSWSGVHEEIGVDGSIKCFYTLHISPPKKRNCNTLQSQPITERVTEPNLAALKLPLGPVPLNLNVSHTMIALKFQRSTYIVARPSFGARALVLRNPNILSTNSLLRLRNQTSQFQSRALQGQKSFCSETSMFARISPQINSNSLLTLLYPFKWVHVQFPSAVCRF